MGLPAEVRRENKQWEREHPRPPRPYYYTQEELAPPKPKDTSLTDRFTTRLVVDGKETELMIQPEGGAGNPKHDGYPTLFNISIGHTHYSWLYFKNYEWKWDTESKPQEFANEVGDIIVAWYQ